MRVLLVEDNPGDIGLIRETVIDSPSNVELAVAVDGESALAFLRKERPHGDAVRPDLLLDLKLPGISGREVLAQVKADPRTEIDSRGRAYVFERGAGHPQVLRAAGWKLRHEAGRPG